MHRLALLALTASVALPAVPAHAQPCNVGMTLAAAGYTRDCYADSMTGFVGQVTAGSVFIEIDCLNHYGTGSSSGPVAIGGPYSGLLQCTFRITATSSGTSANFVAF